ncbi:3790_t:CDS:2 [Scutellospora calospora]|uniref:3790_t:CDS:1 n=1 Tax=Scutellospora calospora TaxID=85575 RepID=A0ACA9LCH5_9GLOM|nr:3790_t:CDS:2 [Scutellospora calospora]
MGKFHLSFSSIFKVKALYLCLTLNDYKQINIVSYGAYYYFLVKILYKSTIAHIIPAFTIFYLIIISGLISLQYIDGVNYISIFEYISPSSSDSPCACEIEMIDRWMKSPSIKFEKFVDHENPYLSSIQLSDELNSLNFAEVVYHLAFQKFFVFKENLAEKNTHNITVIDE